jgi:hypothetical protein
MSQADENLVITRKVVAVFAQLQIPYALGGSMASSAHGTPRFTQDADLTVEPFEGKEDQLIASLGPDYYLSREAIAEALFRRSSFNIINFREGFKVDVFIRKERAFDHSLMARSAPKILPDVPEQPIVFVSPEDIILLKLEWYRIGNETSDRQWSDVLGVLKAQLGKLDETYLDQWAKDLGVSDLLTRARQEARGGTNSHHSQQSSDP